MLPMDEETKGAASSDAPELDVVQPEVVTTEAQTEAVSSTAKDEPERDVLSVVRDVVDKSRPETDAASSAEGVETESRDKAAKEPDNENFSDVPFNKHPRFKELISERNSLKGDADQFRTIKTFMDTNGLTPEETSELLIVGAMAKSDPRKTWERIKPWVQNLLVAAGEVLPEDIRGRVQNGELSHEAALELSRAKATAQSVQASQAFREQQEQRRQFEQAAQSIQSAAVEWEQDRRLKDPNFDAKMPSLQKEIIWLQSQEGKPNTPQGVKEQLLKAYKAVNESTAFVQSPTLQPQRPRPAITPVRGGAVAGNQAPASASTLDIIRAHRKA
jgi:hypothetical protein